MASALNWALPVAVAVGRKFRMKLATTGKRTQSRRIHICAAQSRRAEVLSVGAGRGPDPAGDWPLKREPKKNGRILPPPPRGEARRGSNAAALHA